MISIVMNGSRVTQCLDSLWFYTNILTRRHGPVASLTDHQFAPSIHANEPHMRDLQKPNTPLFLLNDQQHVSQKVESLTPGCHKKFGEISSAFEEEIAKPDNSEMVKSSRENGKRYRRKMGKWNRSRQNGKKVIVGELDWGFDVQDVSGFLKYQESYRYHEMLATQYQTKMPPFDDDVAMKQHLKSWAYAVACTVK